MAKEKETPDEDQETSSVPEGKSEQVAEEITKLEAVIKEAKDKKKELEQKYTFRGLYQKFGYRENVLKTLNMDKTKSDSDKLAEAIEVIKNILAEYE